MDSGLGHCGDFCREKETGMKKIAKSLRLNRETVRVLSGAVLTRAIGAGANTNFNDCEPNTDTIMVPQPSAACHSRDQQCETGPGTGGGGSFATCFAGTCQTIISQ